MSKPAWSWKDYERELAKDERRASSAASKDKEIAVADDTTAARARPLPERARCEGDAPEGTSGAATAAEGTPANASQARPLISTPTAPLNQAVTPADRMWIPPTGNGGGGRLARVRPPADVDRLRRAMAEAADRAKAERERAPGALPVAMSPEECRSCGIPGFKGCNHQAPYQAPSASERAYDYKRAR